MRIPKGTSVGILEVSLDSVSIGVYGIRQSGRTGMRFQHRILMSTSPGWKAMGSHLQHRTSSSSDPYSATVTI